MKILSIKLKNLASLEGVFEIDFRKEPLCSAGIFAITGPTGAGKSTLLDAICLALFAQTPRHLNAKEQGIKIQDTLDDAIPHYDVRGILRKGSVEGFAEVTFVGVDGDEYQSCWSVRRSYGKITGSLQNASMELQNLTQSKIVSDKVKECLRETERLVGLNFNQFTRSVLLAQGDFTAFLKADREEKSSLLEKLTGIDIYSQISRQVYANYKEAESQIEFVKTKLQAVAVLSEEQLQDIKGKKEQIAAQLQQANNEITSLEQALNWFKVKKDLEDAKAQLEVELTKIEDQKSQAVERKKLFQLVEKVQEIKPVYDLRSRNLQNLEEKKSEFINLSKKIKELEQELEKALFQLKIAEDEFKSAESDYQRALPEIDLAKEKDVVLKEKKEQFLSFSEVLENAKFALEKIQNEIRQKSKEFDLAQSTLSALQEWKEKNKTGESIAGNSELILSKLSDLRSLETKKTKFEIELKELENKKPISEKQLKEHRDKIDLLHQQQNELQKKIRLIQDEIQLVPEDQLKNSIEQSFHLSDELLKSKTVWEQLFTSRNEFILLRENLVNQEAAFETRKKEFEEAGTELSKATIIKDQCQKIYDRAQIEAGANVEQLRAALHDGEACPVCGSLHHPYAHESKPLANVLESLQNELKNALANYELLLKKESALEQICQSLQLENSKTKDQLSDLQEKLTGLEEQWNTNAFAQQTSEVSDNLKVAWFDDAINKNKALYQHGQEQLFKIDELKKNVEQLKIQFDQAKDILLELSKKENELELVLKANVAECDRIKQEQEHLEVQIEGIKLEVDRIISKQDWFQKWLQDPLLFTQKLKEFSEKWFDNIKKLEEVNRACEILTESLKGLKNQEEQAVSNLKMQEEKYVGFKLLLENLQGERNRLLQGKEVAIEELRLKTAIEHARQKWELLVKDAEVLQAEKIKNQSYSEKTSENLVEIEKALHQADKQIRNWLENYNQVNQLTVGEEILKKLMLYDSHWLNGERAFFQDLEHANTQILAIAGERNRQLAEHLKKKNEDWPSFEDLVSKQSELTQQMESYNRQKNELEFALKQDEQNKRNAGDLLEELHEKLSVFEDLQKMNELIGSADGKKFRMLAQEYTLEVLLSFANIHLVDLTSRYKLERVPNSLALQVVDQDMGDEIRSVHSLSGGESFLVSLALALGLASLSSNKMKVESLFIDEGFGSLDPATLNVAMDALERLKNQGRKVGVISHVQEMTERIHTQIKVTRLSNGKSKLEVLGM